MDAARAAAKARLAKDSAGMPPGKRTGATDFKPLSPGPKARHGISLPAKEQDSMKEGPIKFVPGSRGHRLDKFKRKGA
jgi:hypothetical protein